MTSDARLFDFDMMLAAVQEVGLESTALLPAGAHADSADGLARLILDYGTRPGQAAAAEDDSGPTDAMVLLALTRLMADGLTFRDACGVTKRWMADHQAAPKEKED